MPIRRTIKNVVKNYSEAQVKVREATSNDPWGPSSTLMSDISDQTYNVLAFSEVMQMIWKRLNDHGKNWRHVYKALMVLDYIIKTGNEKVAQQCRENIYAIQTLQDFQYVEEGKDHGINVREKAKQLVSLLKDDERLKNERTKALKARERFAQNTTGSSYQISGSPTHHSVYADTYSPRMASSESGSPMNPEIESVRPSTAGEEELQLQLALAMSREEAEEAERRKRGDDIKLQLAIEESRKAQSSTKHDDSLLDVGTAKPSDTLQMVDPWATPAMPISASDSWGVSTKAPAVIRSADPWGGPVDPWSPVLSKTNDPWSTATSQNGSTTGSAWQSNPVNNPDDDFDLLSLRTTTHQQNTNTQWPNPEKDAWELTELGTTLCSENKKKTPQEFLGPNANLVNFDNLISAPAGSVNPFAMTNVGASNPFGGPGASARVPMNQMQQNSVFNTPLLPQPMMPPQSNNPFLL